jgi:hypothetical protein
MMAPFAETKAEKWHDEGDAIRDVCSIACGSASHGLSISRQ